MTGERSADIVTAVLLLPVALWMGIAGNPISAIGLLLLSTIAVLRLTSTGVRKWTNEHRWAFLAILIPIGLFIMIGAMPTD
ncbi:hypothetical protein [Natrinema salinisoli]|uniref:hypothetical protein n=1 Tax=Natrinema salinisoli TaxID=2878535 RepID=UPI001CEFCDBD|nr:hypothetical protein [Natrinema salinisoli]